MKNVMLLALLLSLGSLPAMAADEGDAGASTDQVETSKTPAAGAGGKKTTIVYRKRTAVSFDDAVVEGSAVNPEGVYVVTPPEKQFGSLLKLRPNFHRELMRDALLLK